MTDPAANVLRKASRGSLRSSVIARLVDSAQRTLGVQQVAEEVHLVQELAREAARNRVEAREARRRVETLCAADEVARRLKPVLGATTAAVVVAATGDPSSYDSPRALVKSVGLNLREHSSGEYSSALHITKRGSGTARRYLHLAALRLLQTDPVVRAWYRKKVARDGGRGKLRAVVAVTRKLVLGLWHVARGSAFDASKLFDTRRLELETEVAM